MERNKIRRKIFLAVALVLCLTMFIVPGVVAQQGTVTVDNPAEGETVSDIVQVTGTVQFQDFQKYEVYLEGGGNMIHLASVFTPVMDGVLANLDTRTVPDGTYQLVIRAVKTDSNYVDFPQTTFTVDNGLGSPQPPEIAAAPLYAPENGAVARIMNCSNFDIKFDYNSPQGFCSSGDLLIEAKAPNATLCSMVDAFLIPCEYRGTLAPQDGQSEPVTYSFLAEPGKVYEIDHPGGERVYINEISPDEMTPMGDDSMAPSEASTQAEPAIATSQTTGTDDMAAEEAPAASAQESDSLLPATGQAGSEVTLPFVIVAAGLLLFMVTGGVIAIKKGKKPAR